MNLLTICLEKLALLCQSTRYRRHRLSRPKVAVSLVCLLCLAAITNCGSSSTTTTTPPGPGKFNHVVIIFQENRTPDNLFQYPVLISRGADIQSYGYTHDGTMVSLTPGFPSDQLRSRPQPPAF